MLTKACFLLLCIRQMVSVERRPKFLFIHKICLSVWARSSSRKYSSNVSKWIYAIHVDYEYFALKIVYVKLMIRIRSHGKVLRDITANE